MIIFITNKDDITTDFIICKLNARGDDYFRFNTEDLGSRYFVNLDFGKEQYVIFDSYTEQRIDMAVISSVYFRRPMLPPIQDTDWSTGEKHLALTECQAIYDGLYRLLDECYWISRPRSIREAENKIYQIILAKKMGFIVPDSMITTEAAQAHSFFVRNDENCIIKPIRSGFIDDVGDERVIFTTLIEREHIDLIDQTELCPLYLQRNIKKTADIRVTVAGNKVFSARINSQVSQATSIDWRKAESLSLPYEDIKIPDTLQKKCIDLVKILGLEFGAIDFVLDHQGNYIFLEINPNGQWAWIETRLGHDISGAIIHLLTNGGR